jgi:exodeoxyribonuclease VIII
MIQVMLDLETMSTESNAAIASIGAVKFDEHNEEIDSFYMVVDLKSAKQLGLHISQDTVKWWSEQTKEAREHLTRDPQTIVKALTEFASWFGNTSLPVWGNGSDFDNVILSNACRAAGVRVPWKYFHSRCFRTAMSLLDVDVASNREKYQAENTAFTYHNALSDAKFQTWLLRKALYE